MERMIQEDIRLYREELRQQRNDAIKAMEEEKKAQKRGKIFD